MISDNQTNFLYLADALPQKYPAFYRNWEKLLLESKINFDLLPETKDVWAVDYMPVQVSDDRFVQFVYEPDYLKAKRWRKTISDVGAICKAIGITTLHSNIVLDGGNVIRSADAVIMCDKVFRENPKINERRLIQELENVFEVSRIVFVPQDKLDFTGHADGMVRFLDDNIVLINHLSKDDAWFLSAFKMSLRNAGLDYIEIPYAPDIQSNDSARGLYLNYLQMESVIIVPTYGIREDDAAIKILEGLFKGYSIKTIDCNEIAEQGGVLNCISWNIRQQKLPAA